MIRFFLPVLFVLKGKKLFLTLTVIFLYLLLPTLITNFPLIIITLTDTSTLLKKVEFLTQLFIGTISILPPLELFFLLLTALLLGINISLLSESISTLSKQKSVSLSVGGTSLIALAGAGCASCGISILSVLGISVAILPVHGLTLLVISSLLLFLSIVVILKNKEIACRIT